MADRMLTIVITATLTSAVWILAGSGLVGKVAVPQVGQSSGVGQSGSAGVEGSGGPAMPALDRQDIAGSAHDRLIIPVAGVRADQLSDSFTDARGGGVRKHEAIDIMAPRGTPVLAATAGTVEKLFLSRAGGNTIYVRSPDRRTIYYYAHLDHYSPGLAEKQQVQQGQTIGYVGSTGDASPDAPHLHFAILKTSPAANWWDPTQAVDPYPVLRSDAGGTSR